MALLGCEGFDLYGVNNLLDFFVVSSGSLESIVPGAGRCDSSAYFTSTSGAGPIAAVAPATPYEGYVGWAQKLSNYGGVVPRMMIDHNGVLAGVVTGPTIRMPFDGSIQAVRSNSSGVVVGSSSPGIVHLDTWNHFGLAFKVDAVNGYMKVYFNGVLVIDYAGVTTPPSGGSFPGWSRVRWAPTGYLDDLYWGDVSGSAPFNAFLGNLRVEGQLPLRDALGVGLYRQLTPSTGIDHGSLVNENPPDDDTTYLYGDIVDHKETVAFPDITTDSENYLAVQMMIQAKNEGLGAVSIAPLLEYGGSVYEGTSVPLGSNYVYISHMYQNNPATGGLWTEGAVNASRGGLIIK